MQEPYRTTVLKTDEVERNLSEEVRREGGDEGGDEGMNERKIKYLDEITETRKE